MTEDTLGLFVVRPLVLKPVVLLGLVWLIVCYA